MTAAVNPPATTQPAAAPPASAEFADDLAFSIEIAQRAGRLLIDHYGKVERIDYKSARDVVTEVDHLSEALILDAIRDAWPSDGILAEESGEHHAIRGEETRLGEGRTWVIDPLDGTINYANGIPFFCVSVALLVDGQPRVGVVHDPTRDETFSAAFDGPAMVDGRVVLASDKERLTDFVVSLALSGRAVASRIRALRKEIRVSRSMGAAALALAYVGNGRFDAFVQQGGLSAWDVAAGGLIAQRGGAIVTDMAGDAWFDLAGTKRSIGIIAAPPAHHRAIFELVR